MSNAGKARYWFAAGKNKTEAKSAQPFFVLATGRFEAEERAARRAGAGQKVYDAEPRSIGGRPKGSKNKPKATDTTDTTATPQT